MTPGIPIEELITRHQQAARRAEQVHARILKMEFTDADTGPMVTPLAVLYVGLAMCFRAGIRWTAVVQVVAQLHDLWADATLDALFERLRSMTDAVEVADHKPNKSVH